MTGRNDRARSEGAADSVSVEAVATETLLAKLVGQVVDVWADAHGLGRASATRREFGSERVPRHTGRDDFRFLGAFEPRGRLVGFVYGYTGGPGQWWYDKVAGALDDARRAEWLEPAHFELTELAVDPSYQSRGIGTRLHDAVLEGLPHDRALLSALADNARVIRFYEQRGWRVLLPELRFEPGRPLFAILGKELRR
jgi:ribosomal protein S18 acetylase RimI-like enzyme